jgi:AcrR family transcriptional regulator
MSRTSGRTAPETRQALLDVSLELFAEKGYFGTSLREIARAVGLRESALYYHFPSKEALFEALLDEADVEHDASAAFTVEIRDAATFLEHIGTRVLAHFSTVRQRRLHRILMSDGMRLAADGKLNLVDRMGGRAAILSAVMGRLIQEGHLRADAVPDLLALEFMAPLMVWRQMLDTAPAHPVVAKREGFLRAHIDHFLRGAGAPARKSK